MRLSVCGGRGFVCADKVATMTFTRCALLGTILLLALLPVDYVNAARGRGGGHSYPHSGGLSGHGGSHGYPSSGGLSGNSKAHTYPTSGSNHGHPQSNHGYPASPGLSGNTHGYPGGKGMSGNTHTTHHTTNVYNNYHYTPPQQIRYTPAHGPPVNYPVYHGTPPTYVYQYKDSGSKYGTLLAGLALLNLGTLAAGTAYAVSHSHSGSGSGSSYTSKPGEVCKFGIKRDNGDYEETRIDCQLISSFIYQAELEKSQNGGTNTTVVTTSVTNVTMVNTANGAAPAEAAPVVPAVGNVIYTMLPNGTLIPLNGTVTNNATANATVPEAAGTNGAASSVTVTTTTTNTTVTNALDVKGKPVEVTAGMKCYVIRLTPAGNNMRKTVPCGLLQTYADKSLQKNSATRNLPMFTIMAVVLAKLLV